MATAEDLLTAEEFGRRPDPDHPEELLRGKIIALAPHGLKHGYSCGQVGFLLSNWIEGRDLGRIIGNGSGVITERDPDTVRGAEVAYYIYERLP